MMCSYKRQPASEVEAARRERFDAFMNVYWTAMQAWIAAAEWETCTTPFIGRSEELDNYRSANPPLLFKDYLLATAGEPR